MPPRFLLPDDGADTIRDVGDRVTYCECGLVGASKAGATENATPYFEQRG